WRLSPVYFQNGKQDTPEHRRHFQFHLSSPTGKPLKSLRYGYRPRKYPDEPICLETFRTGYGYRCRACHKGEGAEGFTGRLARYAFSERSFSKDYRPGIV